MCSKENLARRTRDLIEYYFASRGDKSWQRLRRKTKGGVAEPVLSCPPKRSSPRYIFSLRRCIVYILFLSNKNAASLFFIDNRSCKNRVSRNISVDKRGGTPRSRANKIYLASSGRAESKEASAIGSKLAPKRRVSSSTAQFRPGCDLTQRELPHRQPTRRPHAHWHWRSLQACTANPSPSTGRYYTLPSRPAILAPRCSMAFRVSLPRTRLAHTSPLLLCTARSLSFTHLSPPPSLRPPPSHPPILRLPSLFLSFRFPFDSVLGFLLPVSRFFLPPPPLPSSLSLHSGVEHLR